METEEFVGRPEVMEHLSKHLFEIYPGQENITKRLECWDEWKNNIPIDKNWFTLKELGEIKREWNFH